MKNLLSIILLLTLSTLSTAKTIDILKSKGTNQTTIVSLTPSLSQIDVDKDITIKAIFNIELDSQHVKKFDIKLKNLSTKKKKNIKGKVSYNENEKTVTFKPNEALEVGYYEVEFKSLKTLKTKKHIKIKEIKYRFYVPQVINGHKLPPEPDETLNDSTLLGIDVNSNGVRDDVERWIYETYKDKHPIHIDIAMQKSRGYKLVLETPKRAREIHDEVSAATFCQGYYQYSAQYYNEPLLIENNFDTGYLRMKIYFNTKERMDAYLQYDHLLSGGAYTLPSDTEKKKACDFNTSKYEER